MEDVSKENKQFLIRLGNGQFEQATYCCVASGGMLQERSLHWIKTMGHTLVPPVPSLFTFNAPSN
ncbi:MAG: aminoacetone oxidase family FAD-binding enzyme, partial [Bacteroidota bacterium]